MAAQVSAKGEGAADVKQKTVGNNNSSYAQAVANQKSTKESNENENCTSIPSADASPPINSGRPNGVASGKSNGKCDLVLAPKQGPKPEQAAPAPQHNGGHCSNNSRESDSEDGADTPEKFEFIEAPLPKVNPWTMNRNPPPAPLAKQEAKPLPEKRQQHLDVQGKKNGAGDAEVNDNGGKKRKRKKRKKSGSDMGLHSDQEDSDFDDEMQSEESGDEEEDIRLSNVLIHGTSSKNVKKRRNAKKRKMSIQKLADMKKEHINHFRKQNHIYASGEDIPDPLETFAQMVTDYNVHEDILNNIMSLGYTTPTPIQMQAIPIMLHRREILACAPTGSGKTAAFLIPILHHLKEPRKLGFRALIVEPTRELAKQVHRECCRLAQGRGFRVHIIDKTDKAIKKFGPESSQKFDILITTPNRLLYLLQQERTVISLKNVEWLIIDESDKLFEEGKKGFRDQLAVIYKACSSTNIRRAMFSATYACDVEEWCKLNLDNVIAVSVGARNSAVDTVEQELTFVGCELGKLVAFRDLVKAGFTPPVLVFVQTKERAKELFNELIYDGINVEIIHADKTQLQRDNVIKAFRAGKIWVLICTELMGRGIDFKGVNLVVNYDFPPSAISYIHRIGRTGRAGRQGKAITFFTEDDSVNLRSIAQVMKNAGCPVPEYMLELKKPSKKAKRLLTKWAMERESISTVPLYDLEKAEKRRQAIKKLRKSKAKPQAVVTQ